MIISVTSEECLLAGELLRLDSFIVQLVSLRLSTTGEQNPSISHTIFDYLNATRVVNLINFPNVKSTPEKRHGY